MKKYIMMLVLAVCCLPQAKAQSSLTDIGGKCGSDLKWKFDGNTLSFENVNKQGWSTEIPDFDVKKNIAPWVKKKLNVKKVSIGIGITKIGSCAFANCSNLQEVVFDGPDLVDIGWGAFMNCSRLKTISLPIRLSTIGTIAFANCTQLPSVKIPDRCRVGNQAFISCKNLQSVEVGPTTILGSHVFSTEVTINDKVRHKLYDKEITRLPSYVNAGNCKEYGFARSAVEKCMNNKKAEASEDYDYATSDVDKTIPVGYYTRNNTYALIIGNQNYRFVGNVPYAIHDARVFADYCKKTLGLPVENVHIAEDATKEMILEEELEDWVSNIPERENKKLIIYYAGHGVPDIKNHNKAYLLPTDVRGTNPKRGIALEDFYARIGELGFNQTSVFLDACFSGVNRDHEGVSEGLRGVEIEAEETSVSDGTVVVFTAAQGNETAQGFAEEGHGLFTYYLLKELQSSQGSISFGDLSDNISTQVSRKALEMKLRKKQTPSTKPSESIADKWRRLQF